MRRHGLIDYSWIVDGTRISDKPSSWSGLEDYVETVAHAYRKDLWARQKEYVEVFVEKDAMTGVVRPVTREYDIRLNANRGYCSETFLWSLAEEWKQIEKPITVYYLGDHDPAGLKIEHDLRKRLSLFCGSIVNWHRLAVTESDFANSIYQGFAPSAKNYSSKMLSDYVQRFGERGVEVDAIPAKEIRERVKDAIEIHIDQREWHFLKDQEKRERMDLLAFCKKANTEPLTHVNLP